MKIAKKLSVALYAALFVFTMVMPWTAAQAATLTTPRDYLSRVQENLTTGEVHQVFFTTFGAVAGGGTANKVIIVFPDGDDGTWCATAGTDLVATGITNPTGGTESATALPGTLTAKCVKGVGASNYDTITVEAVTDLAATTKYGVQIAGGSTGKLGTPANTTTGLITITTNDGTDPIDTAQAAIDIIALDQVSVSATVPPSITFTLSATSINLGTLSTGSVANSSHTVQTITNAANGYATYVYSDGNLRNGSNTIAAVTTNLVAATAGYGIATTDTDQTIANDAACGSAPYTVTALTTSQQSIAGATSGPVDETRTICYAAAIAADTVAGAYTQTVTFVTVGLF
ncbi:MAG: hypothetical protein V1668_04045 [Patescibacteria group bacterium]